MLKHECPVCGSDSFRRDIEHGTEVLELGVDSDWVVIGHEETEHDIPNPFIYCSNCLVEVQINEVGYINVLYEEDMERYYEN